VTTKSGIFQSTVQYLRRTALVLWDRVARLLPSRSRDATLHGLYDHLEVEATRFVDTAIERARLDQVG
jgi:hypothetical protein